MIETPVRGRPDLASVTFPSIFPLCAKEYIEMERNVNSNVKIRMVILFMQIDKNHVTLK